MLAYHIIRMVKFCLTGASETLGQGKVCWRPSRHKAKLMTVKRHIEVDGNIENMLEHYHKLLNYIELCISVAWCVLNHFDPSIMTGHILIQYSIGSHFPLLPPAVFFYQVSRQSFFWYRPVFELSWHQAASWQKIWHGMLHAFYVPTEPMSSQPLNIFFCPCLPYLWIVGGWGSGWRECRWHFGVVAITTATCSNTLCDIGRLQGSNVWMLGELMKIDETWTRIRHPSDMDVLMKKFRQSGTENCHLSIKLIVNHKSVWNHNQTVYKSHLHLHKQMSFYAAFNTRLGAGIWVLVAHPGSPVWPAQPHGHHGFNSNAAFQQRPFGVMSTLNRRAFIIVTLQCRHYVVTFIVSGCRFFSKCVSHFFSTFFL